MQTNVLNDLTDAQKKELSDKIETLMIKFNRMSHNNEYFAGVSDGLNHAYKLVNEINDDYNT